MSYQDLSREEQIAHARACDERIAAMWDLYWAERNPQKALESKAWNTRVEIGKYEKRMAKTELQRNLDSYAKSIAFLEDVIVKAKADAAAMQPAVDEAHAAAVALDKELYEGWQRFFHVIHIHASQHCSSFRPTTKVGWLPDVSGLTEVEAVAEYGANLCTICFPSAPVEWTNGASKDVCAGAGKWVRSVEGGRHGYYGGNIAICPECGQRIGYNRNSTKIPKHKPKAA